MAHPPPALTGAVNHTCFVTVDGNLVLAAARGRGIELIDGRDGTPLRQVDPERAADSMIALPGYDERHDLLLAGGGDGQVRAYDPTTGEVRFSRDLGHGSVKDLDVFGARGTPEFTIVAILDSGLHLLRPGSGEVTRLPDPPGLDSQRMFKICTYVVSGRVGLTCAYTDGQLASWDPLDPQAAPSVQRGHDGPIWSLVTADDGSGEQIVVSGGSDRRMRVWRPRVGAELEARNTFVADGTIRRLGHVTDHRSTMLVTASATGEVALWRLDGPPDRPEMSITRHSGEAWALACASTEDGVVLASGDMNGGIVIKRLSTALLTPESSRVIHHSGGTVWVVAQGATPEGPFVACAGVERSVNVIDPLGRRAPLSLEHHTSTVRALAAGGGPAEAHLVSGGADHQVLDWDPRTGRLRHVLPMGHGGEVWALAVLAWQGATHVISGSADGSVRQIVVTAAGPGEAIVLGTDFGEVNSLVAIPEPEDDDVVLVVGSNRGLRSLRLRAGTSTALGVSGVADVCGVELNGRHLVVVARADGVVQLVDPVAAATISTFAPAHDAAQVKSLQAVEVAGTVFVLGGRDDGSLLVWHIDGTPVSNPVQAGTAAIRDMTIVALPQEAREGRRATSHAALVTAAQDGVVRLWPITADSPLRSGGSVGRSVRPASLLLQDQPTSDDHLSRKPLVDALHAALRSPGTKPPVVIGVHAAWGQGKSSLLRQLRERVDPWTTRFDAYDRPAHDQTPTHELQAAAGKPVRTKLTRAWAWRQIQRAGDHDAPLDYEMVPRDPGVDDAITVWFNPWMYERTDQIWAGLTREILLAITLRLPVAHRERLWFDLNLRRTEPQAMRRRILASYIPRSLGGLAAAVLLLLLLVVAAVAMGVAAVNNPTFTAFIGPSALVMLTVLATIAQMTSGSLRHIHGWVAPDELNSKGGPEHAWKGSADPLTASERGYLYMLQHDVGEVVNLATKHSTLYVFIDDLDRCRPEIVSDTIEAINLFLNKAFGKSIFVVALDPATVAAHLETSFGDINARAKEDETSFGHLRHTGWRFMEKIIDLPIRLPRLPDPALSEFFYRLIDTDQPAPPPPLAQPPAAPQPATRRGERRRSAPRQRRPEPTSTVEQGNGAGATVGVMIVPDSPDTNESVALVDRLEALPQVRDALRKAVLSLPGRNPRQTKAFVNLWRFYMVLDHQMGLFNPSVLALEQHSIEMARLVELMVRWPFLLDPLGELAPDGAADDAINLDRLLDACDSDDWPEVAKRSRVNPDDITIQGLRELLRQALPHRTVFAAIARRYL